YVVPRASHLPVTRDARLGSRLLAEQQVLSPPHEEQHSFRDTLVSHPEQQEQPSGTDKVHSLAEGHARACLADAQRSGDVPGPGVAVQAASGWTVLVAVFPTPVKATTTPPDLSDCERDCITLLSASQKPLTAEKVCYELEAQGIAVYSEISVK